jgi:crooked neck
MVFADDERESNPTSFKFLQMAHAWKSAQSKKTGAGGAGGGMLSGFTAARDTSGDEVMKGSEEDADARSDVASSHGGDEGD